MAGNGRGGKGRDGGGRRPSRRRGRPLIGRLFYWSVVAGLWLIIGVGALVAYHFGQLPPIDQLAVPKRPPNIAILAADGSLLANRGETGGRTVTLGELPPYLPKAFVAIEDHRFHSHWGIDPVGISRAVFRNLTSRGVAQGGSTLTQQLAKNLFLTQERTISRKIQEAILAVWLERNYSKDQILALYLNRVYFGAGAYGVEAAAQRYFGKSARAVTLAEAAVLAGVVQAPSRLAPTRNREAAQARAELVLAAMAREGFVDSKTAKVALMVPAAPVRNAQAGSVNYAADYVMDVLDDHVGAVETDIVVSTTIDPRLQAGADQSLAAELGEKGGKLHVGQGAIVTLAHDGAVKALIGGRSYSDSQFNRATAARRQPGSAFKPFVYLAALERGLTPETRRDDAPITIKGWSPENYSREFVGPVTLTQALAKSLNTVAVRLCVEVGPKTVVNVAQRLGIFSPLKANASLALGTSEVSPLELAAAYTPFANGGIGVTPYIIARVKTNAGKTIYTHKPGGPGRVIGAGEALAMNAMMRETLATGTGRKAELPGIDAAGKTGTTQEFRDAWFVGYTGHFVTAVWLGNDDSTPTRKVSGSNLPTEIWRRYMKTAHEGLPAIALPGGRAAVPVAEAPPLGPTFGAPRPPLPIAPAAQKIPPRERGLLERLFGG